MPGHHDDDGPRLAAGLVSRVASPRRRQSYDRVQIVSHWIVVALVLAQYATSGAIVRTHAIHRIGQRQNPTDLVLHVLHNRVGVVLVAMMIGRLAYRLWAGAPAPAGASRARMTRAAGFVHAAFYGVLITEGITGAIASYLWWPISGAHVILFKVLLALVAIHLAAVLWHQMVLGDHILRRIGLTTPFPRRRRP